MFFKTYPFAMATKVRKMKVFILAKKCVLDLSKVKLRMAKPPGQTRKMLKLSAISKTVNLNGGSFEHDWTN